MKVLQINATYGSGSTGEIVFGIAQAASKYQIEMYFASAIRPNITVNDHNFVIGNVVDHKLHALRSRIFGMQGTGSYLATKKLLKWIDDIKPDIIHLHNIHNNYINTKLLFEYIISKRIPTVITLHDCWFFTGKCCHFLYDNCSKWVTGCGNCPRQRKEIPSYFFDKSAIEFNKKCKLIGKNPYVHVVGCSRWITSCASKSLLKNRIEGTIYNGVDLNIFKPLKNKVRTTLQLDNRFVIMGMANKWLADENRETYEYITLHMKKDMVLLLIGCNQKQNQNNKMSNVIMKGFVKDRHELAEYYSAADVFVNVTKVDSLPTVNIEALACGTPVITYDSGGSAEVVDEDTGKSIFYGNYKKLYQEIMMIKNNGKKLYSKKCRRRAEILFDKNTRFKEYVNLYWKIEEKRQ